MKNPLVSIKSSVVNLGNTKFGMQVRKNSPEICLALGMVSFVGTVVLSCRATLKAEEVIDRHKYRMNKMKEAIEVAEDGEFDAKREKTVIFAHTAVDFMKLYAPSAALGAISMGLLCNVYRTLNGRYIGAVSAFNGVTEAFQAYRNRVIEEEGIEKDRHYRYGSEFGTGEVITVDEKGKEKKTKENQEIMNAPIVASEYARYFDESNPNWDENPAFSLMFLRGQEQIANDMFHTRGHLFLNEVYEMLGYDHTPVGAVVGWVKGKGDDYVDFGLNDKTNKEVRRFVNGKDNIILLDFNVDGVIWDKI